MNFQDLLDKHGKRCSHCGSDQLTSLNSKPLRHRCLDCGLWMYDDEVVIGKEAGEKVAKAFRKKLAEASHNEHECESGCEFCEQEKLPRRALGKMRNRSHNFKG